MKAAERNRSLSKEDRDREVNLFNEILQNRKKSDRKKMEKFTQKNDIK